MRTTHRLRTRRIVAGVALALTATFSLAACGGDGDAGGSAPKPVAAIDALQGKNTQVKLDAGFVKALTSLKLKPGVVGKAKLVDGALRFPITGGNVTVFEPGQVSPYVIGQIQHEGSGFSLTAGGTTVSITNLNVDPGVSRVYGDVSLNGKPVVSSAYVLKLDGRTLKPLKVKGKLAILQGTKVEISPVAAPLLNKVFKTKAVKPGLLVGIAKITVDTRSAG